MVIVRRENALVEYTYRLEVDEKYAEEMTSYIREHMVDPENFKALTLNDIKDFYLWNSNPRDEEQLKFKEYEHSFFLNDYVRELVMSDLDYADAEESEVLDWYDSSEDIED